MNLFRHPPLALLTAVVAALAALVSASFLVGASDPVDSSAPLASDRFFVDAAFAYRDGASDVATYWAFADSVAKGAMTDQLSAVSVSAQDAASDRFGADHPTTELWSKASDAAELLRAEDTGVQQAAMQQVSDVADDLAFTVTGSPIFGAPTAPDAPAVPGLSENQLGSSPVKPALTVPEVPTTLIPTDSVRTPPAPIAHS